MHAAKRPYAPYDTLIKAAMLGDSGAGKSCFMARLCDDSFTTTHISTIMEDFKIKTFDLKRRQNNQQPITSRVKLQLWDQPPRSRLFGLLHNNARGTSLIFVCYDITDEESFQTTRKLLGQIQQQYGDVDIVLLGCKSDMIAERAIDTARGHALAEEFGVLFFECSSKSNIKVEEACMAGLEQVVNRLSPLPAAKEQTAAKEQKDDQEPGLFAVLAGFFAKKPAAPHAAAAAAEPYAAGAGAAARAAISPQEKALVQQIQDQYATILETAGKGSRVRAALTGDPKIAAEERFKKLKLNSIHAINEYLKSKKDDEKCRTRDAFQAVERLFLNEFHASKSNIVLKNNEETERYRLGTYECWHRLQKKYNQFIRTWQNHPLKLISPEKHQELTASLNFTKNDIERTLSNIRRQQEDQARIQQAAADQRRAEESTRRARQAAEAAREQAARQQEAAMREQQLPKLSAPPQEADALEPRDMPQPSAPPKQQPEEYYRPEDYDRPAANVAARMSESVAPAAAAAAAPKRKPIAAAQAEDERKEAPEDFICPISQEIMKDPVSIMDQNAGELFVFEREAIESWLKKNNTNPMTNNKLPNTTVFPNRRLKGAIAKWKEQEKGLGADNGPDELLPSAPGGPGRLRR